MMTARLASVVVAVGTAVFVLAVGTAAYVYARTPTPRECEAAADNLVRIEASERSGDEVIGTLAGIAAPIAARMTGRHSRVVAQCESDWNRKLANCVRIVSTLAQLGKCRAYPWADPVEVAR